MQLNRSLLLCVFVRKVHNLPTTIITLRVAEWGHNLSKFHNFRTAVIAGETADFLWNFNGKNAPVCVLLLPYVTAILVFDSLMRYQDNR